MFNAYVIKKNVVLFFMPLVQILLFILGFWLLGFWWGFGLFFFAYMITGIISILLLKNPFSEMLEGKGVIVLDMNSTGIIRPFIFSVKSPFVHGKIGKQKIRDIFNRKAVFSMTPPITVKKGEVTVKEDGGIDLRMSEEEYNRGRMAFLHYPAMIYNSQIRTLVTKDWFSDSESSNFIEHTLLYYGKVLEELNSNTRDFGRYVVESLKPIKSFFEGKNWVIWVIAAIIVILLIMLGPQIWEQVQSAAANAGATQTVTPR